MKIGIPREIGPGETRVAVTPSMVPSLTQARHEVFIEAGAGTAASFTDQGYLRAGARILPDARSLYGSSEVILKVQPPQFNPAFQKDEAEFLREGSAYLGFLAPVANPDVVKIFMQRRITSFAMEYIPRISRAQSMDALSSMATIAGYKAVLLAAEKLGKIFPLLMTAAGTVPPAVVMVLGAGVAGLQAIATARRLGAKVEAFDPRPAVRDQVRSLGASFIDLEVIEEVEGAGGYAREQSEEFLKKEQEIISKRLPMVDVVISTAQVFGKQPPLLLTAEMVRLLRSGSVIVDLAAEGGGNCELTRPDQTIEHEGVTILGPVNLPASVPTHSSQLYSRNIVNLAVHLYPEANSRLDLGDAIAKGSLITHNGTIANETVKQLLMEKGEVVG